MISEQKTQVYEQMFATPAQHRLRLSSTNKVQRDSMLYETRWLDEHDEHDKLIARYRTWTNLSLKPPYRKQLGWEKYTLSGNLLDREIRYSKRDTDDYLH